jgi:sulfur relay (sulfurtransferase) DsrC/TusE family protein
MTQNPDHDMDIKLLERIFQEATTKHGTDFYKVNGFVRDYIRRLGTVDRNRLLAKLQRIACRSGNAGAHKSTH